MGVGTFLDLGVLKPFFGVLEYVLAMHFCHTWGGGVFRGGEYYPFEVIGYWKPRIRWGNFFILGY